MFVLNDSVKSVIILLFVTSQSQSQSKIIVNKKHM